MGWPMNVQRGFACGLLHPPTTSIASSYKGAASLRMSTVREGLDMCAGDDMSITKDLLHSVAFVLRSDREVSCDVEKWKVWKKGEHGIVDKLIPDYAWKVLRRLQESGHGTYLVGGSVRDLLLKKPPKDFDLITTAPLNKVRKGFSRAWIVGRRFPICTVHIENKIVEVSSFNTVAKVPEKTKFSGYQNILDSAAALGFTASDKCHRVRWENSMKRDFTINGLFYDPFEEILYDYLGGVEDLRKKKVRTVSPANESFKEDSARILRALRIAGRLGFKFARETAKAIQTHSSSLNDLPLDRLRLEAKYLMGYGAAERSLRLLWRFGILEIILPHQAAYFASQGFKRQEKGSNLLLMLLANLDKLLSPSKPCHCCLWINILALHLALYQHPESPVVISALALAIRKVDIEVAVLKAIRLHEKYGDGTEDLPELDTEDLKMSKSKVKRKVSMLCENVVEALELMTSVANVARAMQLYPGAPSSKVAIVSKTERDTCAKLFRSVSIRANLRNADPKGSLSVAQKTRKRTIDRECLQNGCLEEMSFVLSHIVLSTLYPHAAQRRTKAV
ncbi:hypothetical protein GOP47_0007737 [Adiantum capillus-veneris]|uniref:Uncharacterized protein n=1 Tax=Adiantum capillus-veneris TaxID=13818 RepID=A0A9D4V258_ADICA|nr:hypothetical protein GOP47_0007737 [Adiantum capillus-veneris]